MTRRTSRRRTSRAASRRRTSLRRNSAALANTFYHVFSGILTQYDAQQTAKETKRGGHGNIYRLGHYLKALHNIEKSSRGFVSDKTMAIHIRAAIDVNFTPGNPGDKLRKVIDAYLEHGTLPKYPTAGKLRANAGGCAYCQSPPGRHRWWCKKLAKNGKLRRNSKKPRNPYSGMSPMARVTKAAATARSPYAGMSPARRKIAIADARESMAKWRKNLAKNSRRTSRRR